MNGFAVKLDSPIKWKISYGVDGRTYVSDKRMLIDQRYVLVRPLPERGKMGPEIIREYLARPEQIRFSSEDLKESFFGNWEAPGRLLLHTRHVAFLRNLPLGETLNFGLVMGPHSAVRIYDGDFLIGLTGPSGISLDLWEAAESGDAEAQCEVGVSLWAGWEFERDRMKAVRWFKKSADQGCVKAQFYLGQLYMLGFPEISQDYQAAARWFARAAEQNHPKALMELGIAFFVGFGVPIDFTKSWVLLDRAIELGCREAVKKRSAMFKGMPPSVMRYVHNQISASKGSY